MHKIPTFVCILSSPPVSLLHIAESPFPSWDENILFPTFTKKSSNFFPFRENESEK